MSALSCDEAARAAGWAHVIVGAVLGSDVDFVDEGHDRKWGGRIAVDRRDGRWWSYGQAVGGVSIIKALRFLRPGYTDADAVGYVRSFLDAHPGNSPEAADVDDDDAGEVQHLSKAAYARELLERAVPIAGTDGERYLGIRGLRLPCPVHLSWVDSVRPGDGAIIAPLTAAGRTVAIMLTFIDTTGAKSTLRPQRMRLNLEQHHPGAVFLVEPKDTSIIDLGADTIAAEGLENICSVALVRGPAQRLLGLPGIGTLGNVDVRKGERILVFQDSDPEDHPARQGLQKGIDDLVLKGAQVKTTDFSPIGDANAILQAAGRDALKKLLLAPVAAALSVDGEARRLATLTLTEYEKTRKAKAKEIGIRVGYLDAEVKKHRPRPARGEDEEDDPHGLPGYKDYGHWAGPLPPLAEILDKIVEVLLRYVVMQRWQAQLVALWCALTYFVHHPKVKLYCMPRLAVLSAQPEAGKTTLLRIICTLTWRGEITSRTSPAGIYRSLDADPFTMCLDEVEAIVRDETSPFLPILNGSHHREDAFIRLTETRPSGKVVPIRLSTWAAMALAGNGSLPTALESRSLVVLLNKALPGETRDHLWTRETTELITLHRQLETWAGTIDALPFPIQKEIPPEIFNRAGDNWAGLFAIAKLAGRTWFERAKKASRNTVSTERLPTVNERLLASVKRIFATNDKVKNNRITTADLVQTLIGDADENWNTANYGRPVNPHWLREHFRGLLKPAGAQRWRADDAAGDSKTYRGYQLEQFADAFARYPEPDSSTFIVQEPGAPASDTSVTSDTRRGQRTDRKEEKPVPHAADHPPQNQPHSTHTAADVSVRSPSVSDDVPDENNHPTHRKSDIASDLEDVVPDVPDVPDAAAPISNTNIKKENGAALDALAAQIAVDPIAVITVIDCHETNPKRSRAWIAKQTRIQQSVVARILDAWKAAPTGERH